MPWTPDEARKKYKKLGKKQSEVWAQVANKALEAGDDEATAIKKANAVVKRMSRSEAVSSVVSVVSEVGRMISTTNMTKLSSAVTSMKSAIGALEPLIADDAEESAVENVDVDPILKEGFNYQKWELVNLDEAAKILAQDDSYDQIRYAISSALRQRAISDSLTSKIATGSSLGYDDYYDYGNCPYIRDMYDGYVVYSQGGELYQCEYTYADGVVSLGDPTEVKLSYVPTSSSAEESREIRASGELLILQEKAVKDNGSVRVKLISPGWGSSGYYSKEMLKRDGPKVFKAGTHMYMNHPTESEARDRPERDLRDLVGSLTTNATWEEASDSNIGEGLYADANVYEVYRSFVNDAAKDIGVSIRASGTGEEGEAEKRHGVIVNGLNEAFSVDYVTLPGRGGQVMSLFESARNRSETGLPTLAENSNAVVDEQRNENVVDISAEQLAAFEAAVKGVATLSEQLTASHTTIARLSEMAMLNRARVIVSEALAQTELPNITRDRVTKECLRDLPVKDGTLDEAEFTTKIEGIIKEEVAYIESIGGAVTNGKVVGMGAPITTTESAEELDKQLDAAFSEIGYTNEKSRAFAVRGRN
jgi:hypothetical protein